MNSLRGIIFLAALLAIAGAAKAQDFKQSFVGKSPCTPEIQSEHSDFSLALDKAQGLTLLYRDLSKVKILMIVQPTGDSDHCGIIRELIQIQCIAKDLNFAASSLSRYALPRQLERRLPRSFEYLRNIY